MTHISTNDIKQDIQNWLVNYIEENHKFYDYKFPPCPFARSARLRGLIDIKIYESGGIRDFIRTHLKELIDDSEHEICLMVFPPYVKWLFYIKWFIFNLNKKIVKLDYYAQFGTALKTESKYPGILIGNPYFIVIVNKLSDVLRGQQALEKTDYYKPWANHHYEAVVVRRQQIYEKFK